MAKNNNLTDFLKNTADAIRTATSGTSAGPAIDPQDFEGKIKGLVATVTSDATATQENILFGKVAYANGTKVVGTIPTVSLSSPSVTITSDSKGDRFNVIAEVQTSEGYLPSENTSAEGSSHGSVGFSGNIAVVYNYNGNVVARKTATTVTHLSPTITVNTAAGSVTATHEAYSGFVTAGTTKTTLTLPTYSGGAVVPSTAAQTISIGGKYAINDIVVEAIPNQRSDGDIISSGPTVSIRPGYYTQQINKTVKIVDQASPTFAASTQGSEMIVYARCDQTTGYVNGGLLQTLAKVQAIVTGRTVDITLTGTSASLARSVPEATRASTIITTSVISQGAGLFQVEASNNQTTGYVEGTNATANQIFGIQANGPTVTITKNNTGEAVISKTVALTTHPSPSITLSTLGTIVAEHVQSTGYVTGGTATATLSVKIAEDYQF